MTVDESISRVNVAFGLPITGHGPTSLVRRLTAKFIWPFLRHQVDVNHVLVAELREMQSRQERLQSVIEDGLHNVENALHILEGQYTSVLEQRESHLADVQTHVAKRTLQLESQIDLGLRQLLARFYDGFGALQRDVTQIATNNVNLLQEVQGERDRIATNNVNLLQEVQGERDRIATLLARMAEVDHFLTEVKRSYPELVKPERLVTLATGFDAVERAHALRFRGTREEIIERVTIYLPELKSVAELGPVLDIGCGGGELLEVLKANNIAAYGIEIVDAAVDKCRAAGLDARLDDALHHLSSVPKSSLGAVTAIHVVEHLGINTLIEVIDLSLQALKPGGMIIFETPNPGNVMVGADSFYLDPTHDHPIPSALLDFLVSIRGFTDAQVVPLKRAPNLFTPVMPDEGVWANDVSRVAQHVANVFLGAEDYSVIARRAI
jgi:2-polyprenyl-3-methyl-5-hydroxy-6-metoxy-1,4-benzoquinol methylase/FtsZ-binding cell division protein ZapB